MATPVFVILSIIFFYVVAPNLVRKFRAYLKNRKTNDFFGFADYEIHGETENAVYFANIVNTLKFDFPWYNRLTHSEKIEFARRTFHIRRSKTFHGMEDFVVQDRHEILLSATLAKLTFGLKKDYELPTFQLIQIYPSSFHSKILEREVKGLTVGNGRIFLSWQHFEEGHDDDDDKIHVGLHEFAHAMMIEHNQFSYAHPWYKWENMGLRIMNDIRKGETHFFRSYGATNIHEMWAVTVESFFEQPIEFRKNFPDFYYATVAMLNQDPCARMEILEMM